MPLSLSAVFQGSLGIFKLGAAKKWPFPKHSHTACTHNKHPSSLCPPFPDIQGWAVHWASLQSQPVAGSLPFLPSNWLSSSLASGDSDIIMHPIRFGYAKTSLRLKQWLKLQAGQVQQLHSGPHYRIHHVRGITEEWSNERTACFKLSGLLVRIKVSIPGG